MNPPVIGFVGFGEAGSRIAAGLRKSYDGPLAAFDVHANTPGRGERIRERAAEIDVQLVGSNADLAARAAILIAVTTAASALDAARQNAPHLTSAHIYADFNSVSPATKAEIAEIIGSRFVEGAIMAPVPKENGHQVPVLLNGPLAARMSNSLQPFNMTLEVMSGAVGAAAATKMCRSIVIKGLEALLFECVLAASEYGAEDRVFESLQESYPGIDWKSTADYMVNRVTVHGERRAHEMEEVAETLRAAGIEPLMAEATAQRQAWAARLDLKSHFPPEGPTTYAEVLRVMKGGK